MDRNIFDKYRTKEDLDEALKDPVEYEILTTNAWRALSHWMMSPKYKNRPTSYFDQVIPVIFPDLFEEGSYGRSRAYPLHIWKTLGWVKVSYSNRGWDSSEMRSQNTEDTYRSMARSRNPEIRSRGEHLLYGSGSKQYFALIQVDPTPIVEYLRLLVTPLEYIGKSKKKLVEDLKIPLPTVKVLWKNLIETQECEELMKRVDGSMQRVLKDVYKTDTTLKVQPPIPPLLLDEEEISNNKKPKD